MSVCEEKDKIEKIVNTLVSAYRYKGVIGGLDESVVSHAQMREIRALCKGDENEVFQVIKSKMFWFGNRLYWANQTAMMITYPDASRTLIDISDKCADGSSLPMTFKEIYNTCQMIQYNCTSNGGTETLTKADNESLTELMLMCANHFCRGA